MLSRRYSLAPENPFPVGLNQLVEVYDEVSNGLVSRLVSDVPCEPGATFRESAPEALIVVGESAGGNLAAAVAIATIQLNLRRPDGLLLCYPCLNLSTAPAPSRTCHAAASMCVLCVPFCDWLSIPTYLSCTHSFT